MSSDSPLLPGTAMQKIALADQPTGTMAGTISLTISNYIIIVCFAMPFHVNAVLVY